MSGVECLARQIAENFGDAKILITVREPSTLLVSAYFNSLRLRRSAMGFRNGEPVFREAVRFMHLEEWWEKLRNSPEISLAGLLDYPGLRTALGKWVDPEQVYFLKLEEMADRSQSCSAKLLKLGFDQDAIDRLLHAPPENTGVDKKLQKERPFAFALGRKLAQAGMARPLTFALRASGLIRPAQKILYGGNYRARSEIDQKLLNAAQRPLSIGAAPVAKTHLEPCRKHGHITDPAFLAHPCAMVQEIPVQGRPPPCLRAGNHCRLPWSAAGPLRNHRRSLRAGRRAQDAESIRHERQSVPLVLGRRARLAGPLLDVGAAGFLHLPHMPLQESQQGQTNAPGSS